MNRKRVYYLARSFLPNVGGGLIRSRQVELLREAGCEVIVVTPDYQPRRYSCRDERDIKISAGNIRFGLIKQYLGLSEDYLDGWSGKTFRELAGRVTRTDIVFASASGELACLKVASRLNELVGCRYIANLHDPLTDSTVDGIRFGSRFHASRDALEERYLRNAEFIVTSSASYEDVLRRKYPHWAGHLTNCYFGYCSRRELPQAPVTSGRLSVAYAGTFQTTQRPEILAKAAVGVDGVELHFLGHHADYRPLDEFRSSATFTNSTDHSTFLDYMARNVDVGFLSLAAEQYRVCVPSKLFEYLNLGLPVLGALPDGDAADIINRSGYGIAVHYLNLGGIRAALRELTRSATYEALRTSVLRDRASWDMRVRFADVIRLLGIAHQAPNEAS